MVSHFFAQVITENFLWRKLLPILQWGDEVTQQKSVLFISVKRKTSFMLVHQKIQLSSNSVEHNHISHQLKKGNHDLLHYLNWILFLTVMLWLSGIMIFVVSSNQQGTGWPKSKFPFSNCYNSETRLFWPHVGKAKIGLRGGTFFLVSADFCSM